MWVPSIGLATLESHVGKKGRKVARGFGAMAGSVACGSRQFARERRSRGMGFE